MSGFERLCCGMAGLACLFGSGLSAWASDVQLWCARSSIYSSNYSEHPLLSVWYALVSGALVVAAILLAFAACVGGPPEKPRG